MQKTIKSEHYVNYSGWHKRVIIQLSEVINNKNGVQHSLSGKFFELYKKAHHREPKKYLKQVLYSNCFKYLLGSWISKNFRNPSIQLARKIGRIPHSIGAVKDISLPYFW